MKLYKSVVIPHLEFSVVLVIHLKRYGRIGKASKRGSENNQRYGIAAAQGSVK